MSSYDLPRLVSRVDHPVPCSFWAWPRCPTRGDVPGGAFRGLPGVRLAPFKTVDLLERRGLVAVLVVVAVAGCATGQKRDLLEVHSVRIEGARKVDEGDVKKHILTTENSWVPFSRKQYFDEDAWKTDLRRIEKYYRAQGFYQAKVTREEVKPHGRKEVDVVASVEEGDPTHVGSVDLHGFDDLPQDDRKRLLEQVNLAPGQVFIVERWEGLKEK